MKIGITIPAYNEERTIGKVIEDIKKSVSKNDYNYQIFVVDDGSQDRTAEIAKKHGAIITLHGRNKGLSETFQTEIKQCLKHNCDIIVHMDADGQYLGLDIPRLIKKLGEGYDLVLGSRFSGKIESMPFTKRAGNIAFAKLFSMLIKTRITDSTTGFRAFTKEVASEIRFINNFTYTQEQILKAAKMKFKITEIPVYAKKTRESKLFKSPFEYAIKAWLNILRIERDFAPLKFFGSIGLFFFGTGALIGAWLVILFFSTGKVGHIPLTILSFLLINTGIQIMLFGFLADKNK